MVTSDGDGNYEKYDSNGKIISKWSFKDDLGEGLFLSYHSNGRMYKKIEMKNGKIHGKYKEWDNNGILKKDMEFDNDFLIKNLYKTPNCFNRFISKLVTKILYKDL